MKENIQNDRFDTRLYPSDWRHSASIVGLVRYFNYHEIPYEIKQNYISYNQESVIGEKAKENYLLFVESYFEESMHHRIIEKILKNSDSFSDEQISLINEKLGGNSICKKIFSKIKFPQNTKEEILNLIEINRFGLIQETYRYGNSMYRKYSNTNKLFGEEDTICRLNNYYADIPKKGKSLAYKWNYENYVSTDIPEFDYIPFAFSKSHEAYFINNNTNIVDLINTNDILVELLKQEEGNKKPNPRVFLFRLTQNSAEYIKYAVEVIFKKADDSYFQTLFIRSNSVEIFSKVTEKMYQVLEIPYKLGEDYINIVHLVTDSIINQIHLDNLIERLMKVESPRIPLIGILIYINQLIYGGENMDKKTTSARLTGYDVRNKMRGVNENKLKSYQQKLISALSMHDSGRFCEILIKLASSVEIPFDFAYPLFDDFDNNKNIAYAFTLALSGERVTKNDKEQANNIKGE